MKHYKTNKFSPSEKNTNLQSEDTPKESDYETAPTSAPSGVDTDSDSDSEDDDFPTPTRNQPIIHTHRPHLQREATPVPEEPTRPTEDQYTANTRQNIIPTPVESSTPAETTRKSGRKRKPTDRLTYETLGGEPSKGKNKPPATQPVIPATVEAESENESRADEFLDALDITATEEQTPEPVTEETQPTVESYPEVETQPEVVPDLEPPTTSMNQVKDKPKFNVPGRPLRKPKGIEDPLSKLGLADPIYSPKEKEELKMYRQEKERRKMEEKENSKKR
eukprot:sb/3467976/